MVCLGENYPTDLCEKSLRCSWRSWSGCIYPCFLQLVTPCHGLSTWADGLIQRWTIETWGGIDKSDKEIWWVKMNWSWPWGVWVSEWGNISITIRVRVCVCVCPLFSFLFLYQTFLLVDPTKQCKKLPIFWCINQIQIKVRG